MIHAAERIMGLVLQRLMTLGLAQAFATETLGITATILVAILLICGLSSFVLETLTNVYSIFCNVNYLKRTLEHSFFRDDTTCNVSKTTT